MLNLKELFLLDPEIVFLNHGSFGATPSPVFESYQEWQRRLERQPVQFLVSEFPQLDLQARQLLGEQIGATAGDLAFITNATYGINLVARSLGLKPGDEILTSNHEYGACDKTWEFICRKTGATYKHQTIPLPVVSNDEMVDYFWKGVTSKTSLIFLSHITSPTALRLPVETICSRAKEAGILTLIDGAHAPGQIALDLNTLGADFYTGNLHKWFMAPKGAAFLYVDSDKQHLIEPLVVSWGWNAGPATTSGSAYIDILQWQGTKDPSAALSVPAAIRFQNEYHWEGVRNACHELLVQAITRICDITEIPSIYKQQPQCYYQMGAAALPAYTDVVLLKRRLLQDFRIEIPCIDWEDRKFIRVSVQGYNTQSDIDALIIALQACL
jgi:isopenicillin-N epimerase